MSIDSKDLGLMLEHLKGYIEKDYLSEKQAAEYCCVSLRQFQTKAKEENIISASHFNKKVYRKSDLTRSIENKFKSLKLPH